jgi:hypothetical protein
MTRRHVHSHTGIEQIYTVKKQIFDVHHVDTKSDIFRE